MEAFPTLNFRLSGVDVQVGPRSYFLPTSLNGQQAYCFGVGQWNEDFAILGYTFMRGYPFKIYFIYVFCAFIFENC